MTNYRRGVETERKIMAILEEAGYEVFRTAQSRGPFDVGGIGPNSVRFIQSKRSKEPTGWESEFEQAMEILRKLPKIPSVSYECWVWVDRKGFIKREVV